MKENQLQSKSDHRTHNTLNKQMIFIEFKSKLDSTVRSIIVSIRKLILNKIDKI